MAYWNDPRVRVLKKYGILIDAEPEVLDSLPGKLPPADGDMTLHQWKLSIFGEPVDVGIFSLEWPYGNTKMKTLNGWGGEYVKQVLRHQAKVAKQRKQGELEALQLELAEAAGKAHVPKELLEAEVDDLEDSLQPSVKEFFARELEKVDDDVSMEQLLQKMLRFMNTAAAGFAQSQQRIEKLQKRLDALEPDTADC
ncbi:hypothetical protein BTW10_14000 [Chromohalobacter japonicus]|uniref:Uncharacterized protein n=1 Tax=Chromohalobacter japonicus TaxID=223900 RepID=A0A1Q8T9W3_9GAMM|nr:MULTISPECIES: hypothetical protein [Chromohalobacter]OLO10467.1 hypothetical protein BTW10_14000 [Chromohalobacter japonicus]